MAKAQLPLTIARAHQAKEPFRLTSVAGDATGARAEQVRTGSADVRLEVFVEEQQVPLALEIDARDDAPGTIHLLASDADGTPLGTARLLLEPEPQGQVHLGRLAVRQIARGTGLGARLVAAVEEEALRRAAKPLTGAIAEQAGVAPGTIGVMVVLSAQEQAMGFYQRCGYRAISGQPYLDAGIWHQDMFKLVLGA